MSSIRPYLPVVLFIAAALATGLVFRYPLVTDDPFITYRYARNLVQGVGFVYNPGENVLSTTTPLYTLVLAALGLVYGDIPALGFWLSVVSCGIAAFILYTAAASVNLRAGRLLAGALFLLAPALVLTFGLETGFYLMLGIAALRSYHLGHITFSFALIALLTLTRNDGIILGSILGAHYVLTHRDVPRGIPLARQDWLWLRPFLIFGLILTPWLVYAWLHFGTPLPFTLAAKIAQAQSGLWDPFLPGLYKWLWDNVLWLAPLLAFAAVGCVWLLRARSFLLLAGVWAVLHLTAYALLGVAFYPWYVAPLLPALALFAGIGVEVAARAVTAQETLRPPALVLITFVGLVLLTLELRADMDAGMSRPSPKVEAYERVAEWLAANTAPDAPVDALEVGVIGYYDGRRTLDFVGLVDPQRIPYLRTRQFADGVRRAAADYVVAIPPDTWLPENVWFKDAYAPVQEIRVRGLYSSRPLVIYRRADAGRAPSETIPLEAAFENRIELQSVDLYTRAIEPGARFPIRLHLRTRDAQAVPEVWKFTLQLVGAENRVVAQTDNFYPVRLPPDTLPFVDHQAIPIPSTAPPGTYDLILAMYDVEHKERLSIYDPTGKEIGDFLQLGQVEITD